MKQVTTSEDFDSMDPDVQNCQFEETWDECYRRADRDKVTSKQNILINVWQFPESSAGSRQAKIHILYTTRILAKNFTQPLVSVTVGNGDVPSNLDNQSYKKYI